MNKLIVIIGCSLLVACSAQRGAQKGVENKIGVSADRLLFKDSTIANAHIGISIYDPATGNTGITTRLKNILCRQVTQSFMHCMRG